VAIDRAAKFFHEHDDPTHTRTTKKTLLERARSRAEKVNFPHRLSPSPFLSSSPFSRDFVRSSLLDGRIHRSFSALSIHFTHELVFCKMRPIINQLKHILAQAHKNRDGDRDVMAWSRSSWISQGNSSGGFLVYGRPLLHARTRARGIRSIFPFPQINKPCTRICSTC
jgi:hypothetical protein